MLGRPQLLLVTFGNMLVSLTFAGAVTTFFPLYGRDLMLTQAMIGSIFALRAAVSTVGRFPNSALSRRFGSRPVMLGAVLANVIAMFGIASTSNPTLLAALLALEGLAFGGYLVAGQTYLADNTTPDIRGTAIGIYATASGVGGAIAPLLLGAVAEQWGLRMVFVVTGWVLAAGFVIFLFGSLLLRGSEERGT
jgi:YNFM family putative membrane transporter